jgi:hypothetical protein
MADEKMTLLESLHESEEPPRDFLREAVRWLLRGRWRGKSAPNRG